MPFKSAELSAIKRGDRVSFRVGNSFIDGEVVKVWGDDQITVKLDADTSLVFDEDNISEFKIYERSAREKFDELPILSRFRVRDGIHIPNTHNATEWRVKVGSMKYYRPAEERHGDRSASLLDYPASSFIWEVPETYKEV